MSTDRLFNKSQGDSLLSILAQIRDGYNSVDNVPSLSSENPLQNKIVTGAITDIIETLGGTAQRSYAIGQYFLANDGYYYVATAAITAGSSTISTGTGGNCSKTSVAAGMNTLASQISNFTPVIYDNYSDFLVPDSKISSINYIYGYRVDKRVRLVFVCNIGDSAISAWTTAFSMKPFFTPKVGATGFVMRVTSSVSVNTGIVNISTYGGAQCNTNLLATGAYLFVLDYIVS